VDRSHTEYIIQNKQHLEEHLSRIETKSANTLRRVVDKLQNRNRFDKSLRPELAVMVALQLLRTNEQLQSMIELDEKLEKDIMGMVSKINQVRGTNFTAKDLEIAFNPAKTKLRHKMNLFDNQLLMDIAFTLANHIWVIAVNDTKIPFYTSDHPVAKKAHKTNDWRSNAGYASEGIEIVFPLTSKYVLHMYERSFHWTYTRYENQLVYAKRDHVTYCNHLQVYSSYRQVYCQVSEFDLVKTMIEEQPYLKNPQSRWLTSG
jgi:hypothetical protein